MLLSIYLIHIQYRKVILSLWTIPDFNLRAKIIKSYVTFWKVVIRCENFNQACLNQCCKYLHKLALFYISLMKPWKQNIDPQYFLSLSLNIL